MKPPASHPPGASGSSEARARIDGGLIATTELDALACVDFESGAILGVEARDGDAREALDLAAQAAAELCLVPRLGTAEEEDDRATEAMVVSDSKIHLFAFSKRRPELVMVGVAPRHANVGLLLASVRKFVETLVDTFDQGTQ